MYHIIQYQNLALFPFLQPVKALQVIQQVQNLVSTTTNNLIIDAIKFESDKLQTHEENLIPFVPDDAFAFFALAITILESLESIVVNKDRKNNL